MKLFAKPGEAITSLLEVDAYKFTMGAFIHRFFPNLQVRFEFINRTRDVALATVLDINALKDELNALRELRLSQEEIGYLRGWGIFSESYLQALANLRLPEFEVGEKDGQLRVAVEADWLAATFVETMVLAIVAERYAEAMMGLNQYSKQEVLKSLEERLDEKVRVLAKLPELSILQFGLRRRFARNWEQYATERVYEMTHGFAGVSNVALARKLGVEPLGTNAHELPMALAALRRHESAAALVAAQYEVLAKWERVYGQKLLIILPDTFGSRQFFAGIPREYLESFRGVRQDSGDPFAFAEHLLGVYRQNGIDPRQKMIIFSDGLTLDKMIALYGRFGREFGQVSFGWGTNFTNDSGIIKPLSLVMKLTEAAGNPAVKLSDNLAKAVGDPQEVAYYKKVFGYAEEFREEPVY